MSSPRLHVLVLILERYRLQPSMVYPAKRQAEGRSCTPALSCLTIVWRVIVWRVTALNKPVAIFCMSRTRRTHRQRPWQPARTGAAGWQTAPRQTRRSAGAAASTPEERAQRSQRGRPGNSGSAHARGKRTVTWTAALMSLTLKLASASAATASLTYCAAAHPLELATWVQGPARCVCGPL